jgi:hypothetical protein
LDLKPSEKDLIKRFVAAKVLKDEYTALKWCEEALS